MIRYNKRFRLRYPIIALVVLVMVSSSMVTASFFSFPSLDRFTFGSMVQPAYSTGPFTMVNKFSMPLNDLSTTSGIGMPFGGISPFYSPYTYSKSYTRSTMGPEGPVTQAYKMTYDSDTGEQTVTYTN